MMYVAIIRNLMKVLNAGIMSEWYKLCRAGKRKNLKLINVRLAPSVHDDVSHLCTVRTNKKSTPGYEVFNSGRTI